MYTVIGETTHFDWNTGNTLTVLFGIVGWVLFVFERIKHRTDARNKALTETLEPFIEGLQNLRDANVARKTREQLLRSYPNYEDLPQVKAQLAGRMETYNTKIAASVDSLQRSEQAFASRLFLFPLRLRKLIDNARQSAADVGTTVNNGFFDQADLNIAGAMDHYKAVMEYAAGVKWQAPFASIRRRSETRFARKNQASEERFPLSDKEIQEVLDLLAKRVTTQAPYPFVIHAPKKLLDNPTIAQAEDVIEQLDDAIFEVVFQDGTAAMLSLPALMVFTYHLLMLPHAIAEMSPKGPASGTMTITSRFSIDHHIMRSEMVKALLSKISFSSEPSDH